VTYVLTYEDPVTGCAGYLAYDRMDCRLAAGGCRVQPGLTLDVLTSLAARMTLKQRLLGVNVDGAKSGLCYDPSAADAPEVLRRFIGWLGDELRHRYSMGCDMGTRFEQLERTAAGVGLPSVKYAIRSAQGLTREEFHRRMRVLDARVGRRTVGQRRAGHALAHAALAAARAGGHRARGLRVGLQGFGTLGRAAAESLAEDGADIVAVADVDGCVVRPYGLDTARMLVSDQSRPVGECFAVGSLRPAQALLDVPVDVLVLAASADAVSPAQAATLPAPIVVVGANCGLSQAAEQVLVDRGVLVVPDVVGGVGGSASMEALFGPARTPSPADVLDSVATLVAELVSDVLTGARNRGVMPSQVAADIAAAARVSPDHRPYGRSPYLPTDRRPSGNRAARSRRTNLIRPTGGLS
jgi:glutamate dehydrogenase (NAD(P)+)